jgi:hypothetical protein
MQPRVARTPSTKHLSFLLPTKAAMQDKQFFLPVFFFDGKETETTFQLLGALQFNPYIHISGFA